MTLWYATRAFGVVSLLLLSTVMVLGLLTAGRRTGFVAAGLHRTLSMLSVVFIALHVVSAVTDGYVPLKWLDIVVPFSSDYQPLWTGLGAVAVDLLIALVVTSLLRVHLGLRSWRAVHWLAYLCWPIALAHGLGQGTDNISPLLLLPAAMSVLVVGGAAILRTTQGAVR